MSTNFKKPDYFILTNREEEAMKVLWTVDHPLSASEIAELIPNRNWPATSIQGILRSLEKKGAVYVSQITKLGKSYGRLFRPSISSNDYAAMQFERYYQTDKGDAFSMLSALLGNTDFKNDDIEKALKDLLKKY